MPKCINLVFDLYLDFNSSGYLQTNEFFFQLPGAFSRKAFEKLGFVVRSEVSYADYEDGSTGKRPFAGKDMGPHKCTTLLTKDLSEQ